jgi:hypothetical protein
MFIDEKPRVPLFGEDKNKETQITLNADELSVLIETLTFAKNVYSSAAKKKYEDETKEDKALSYQMEYNSLLVAELIDRIVKDTGLAEYGGVLH